MLSHLVKESASAIPLHLVVSHHYHQWLKDQDSYTCEWLKQSHFGANVGNCTVLPSPSGEVAAVLVVVPELCDIWTLSPLPCTLPGHTYQLIPAFTMEPDIATRLATGWLLGCYQFTRYRKNGKKYPKLVAPQGADTKLAQMLAETVAYARDLITTPANDMGPQELAEAAEAVADECKAQIHVIVGEDLLAANYPAIYHVGKASARAPRLVDIRWGKADAPKVTLVGKGVCFDTGGLDLKPSSNMRLMKKDMAGAAICLALARLIMKRKLNVRLRVLLPLVENSVSGNAMRPLDIIPTRKGVTVEIGNTDAEGRLILGDALFEADSERPDILVDCATLTGAARVALGTEMPALFTPDDALAAELAKHSVAERDPLWRLPLWQPYRELLNSKFADMSNDPESPYGGAITAALYLKEFVPNTQAWAHLDMMAWNQKAQPGRPIGGEAQCLRALYALLAARYA